MREISESGTHIGGTDDYMRNLERMGRTAHFNAKLIDDWCNAKKLEGCSPATINGYRQILRMFAYIMDKKLTDITTADIRGFLIEYQHKRDAANSHIDGLRRYLTSFYNYLEEEGKVQVSPARRVHKIKSAKTVKKPFTEDELVLMEFHCTSVRDRAMISFLISTGVRVGELIKLDYGDLDMRDMEVVVYGKGSKERVVYFDNRTKYLVQEYLKTRDDDNPALFVTDNLPHERITRSGVQFIIRELGDICGIEKCHPHRFRRTFATRLLNRGMPIEQVQRLLGHSKIDTTLIYAEISQENVKSSYRKFQ